MRTPRGLCVLLAALVLFVGCSSSAKVVRARAGHPAETTTSVDDSTSTSMAGPPVSTALSVTTSAPSTSAARPVASTPTPVQAAPLAATTPSAPPPPQSSGRGAVTGHVYASCGASQPSGCRSQSGVGGEMMQVKRDAAVVASTVTAADGTYRVEITAGTYDVQVTRTSQSRRVVVDAGQIVVVDFTEP
ncbi:MAG TPA: hypothetical protein VG076_12545 [Acidimicrobiales bacterium]|nr:hypothetical protein [Acidimicrobiales bacterium]